MYQTNCRHFSGYKPCSLSKTCDSKCPSKDIVDTSILLIHLGALGAVLRSTSLLAAIKRKFPKSKITWVTQPAAKPLLEKNPLVDQVLGVTFEETLKLRNLQFDVAYVIDKDPVAAGILTLTSAKDIFGFTVHPKNSAILPANPEAQYLWGLGLNDQAKFFVNEKPETELVAQALGLPYQRDPYVLALSQSELLDAHLRREKWINQKKIIIGLNTGCSNIIPYKKLTVSTHRKLISKLRNLIDCEIVLLGGKEDTQRNIEIAKDLDVHLSPTDRGLRDGAVSMKACDVVVSGDSLGMHLAIALNKWVVAWFGPTCAQEIDLFGRGVKVRSAAPCAPCWKRSCQKEVMCYDLVPVDEIVKGCLQGISKLPQQKTWDKLGECAY